MRERGWSHSQRRADFRGAKLLSSPSISASHHSAQRQSMSKMQAAALNNSRAGYWTPLAACQYRLCLGLFSQLLAMPGRLGGGRSLVRSTWEGFVESLCMSTSLLLDLWKENFMSCEFLRPLLWAAEVKMDSLSYFPNPPPIKYNQSKDTLQHVSDLIWTFSMQKSSRQHPKLEEWDHETSKCDPDLLVEPVWIWTFESGSAEWRACWWLAFVRKNTNLHMNNGGVSHHYNTSPWRVSGGNTGQRNVALCHIMEACVKVTFLPVENAPTK